MQGLRSGGVDCDTRRVIQNWLRLRSLKVRLKLSPAIWRIAIHPISRGLPQGGEPPPLLWLIFFNDLPAKLAPNGDRHEEPEVVYCDLPYADEFTSLISADTLDVVVAAAKQNAQTWRRILEGRGLQLNEPETNCMLLDPAYLPGEVFLRALFLRTLSTPARVRDRLEREERIRVV